MDCENPAEYDALQRALEAEHKPTTATEHILVEKMAQQYWLSQRAQTLHTALLNNREAFDEDVQSR